MIWLHGHILILLFVNLFKKRNVYEILKIWLLTYRLQVLHRAGLDLLGCV